MDQLPQNPESQRPSPAPISVPVDPENPIRWIFIGQNGIRAGWGIALFIAVVFACAYCIRFVVTDLLHIVPHRGNAPMSPLRGFIGEGLQLLVVVIATGILALVERKPLIAYGYQGAHRALRFFSGLVWGFIAISALVLSLWATGNLVFEGQSLHGFPIVKYALEWGFMFLLVGLCEESMLRGYVQYTFTRGIGFWWGALILSCMFGFGHSANPGESPIGLFAAGAVGLVFCLSIWYTGSLWWAVGCHAAWDWGESYFYGTSDSGMVAQGHLFSEHPLGKVIMSGGLTGPEGSLYTIPLLLIMALCMWLWWGRRGQSPFAGQGWRPAWSRKPHVAEVETTAS
ncbi:MAG TPA: CPBP family intramembrane glutamic endopeptidase [Terracidiphilus sp.]|nr:CPBP family intramembrane glutamic endopeptidase [Terracidiphilus sp.]